jgi:hypothetical protein
VLKCSEVLQCSDNLSNKVSNIVRRQIDNSKLLLICILLLSHSFICILLLSHSFIFILLLSHSFIFILLLSHSFVFILLLSHSFIFFTFYFLSIYTCIFTPV